MNDQGVSDFQSYIASCITHGQECKYINLWVRAGKQYGRAMFPYFGSGTDITGNMLASSCNMGNDSGKYKHLAGSYGLLHLEHVARP